MSSMAHGARVARHARRRHRQDKQRDPMKNPLLVRRAAQRKRTLARALERRAHEMLESDGADVIVTPTVDSAPEAFVLVEAPTHQGVFARLWAWLRGR